MTTSSPWSGMRRPFAVTAAIGLAAAYGALLVAVAALVLLELVTGDGSLGRRDLDGQAVKGVLTVVLLLPLAALMLWRGGALLARARDPRLLALPLVLVFGFGCIGESVDLVGTASARSDLIGAGILAATGLPLLLLCLPRSRAWISAGWSLPRR